MNVPVWVWVATIAGLLAVLAVDLTHSVRHPGEVPLRHAALWTGAMVALAVGFGATLAAVAGGGHAGEFFAGWITEYTLSIDNLFVFVVIIARFAVPREHHSRVLLLGVVVALLLRGAFIAAGAAVLSRFDWIFYLFGAFLIYTAITLARGHAAPEPAEGSGAGGNRATRLVRRFMPVTDDYDGGRLTTRRAGRRYLTPMFLVIVAIGTTDLMFALDSIPAIFGLTRQPYLVFTANLFALLGLRHLYFLLGGLLRRLAHLSLGLAVILGFIGVKMIVEALRGSGVHHLGAVPLPHIGTAHSLGVIVAVLAVTTVTSLAATRAGAGADQRERRELRVP